TTAGLRRGKGGRIRRYVTRPAGRLSVTRYHAERECERAGCESDLLKTETHEVAPLPLSLEFCVMPREVSSRPFRGLSFPRRSVIRRAMRVAHGRGDGHIQPKAY